MDNEIDELKRQIADLQDKINNPPSQEVKQETESLNKEEVDEFSWQAPVRFFIPWERRQIITLILWVGIIILVLLFLKEFILILTIILLATVTIFLVSIPPKETTHRITNKGIHTYDSLYLWEDLVNFWLVDKKGIIALYITTNKAYPGRLFFIVPNEQALPLTQVLSRHLKYFERREVQTKIDRFSDGLYIKYDDIKNLTPSNTPS